ncbi:DNA polymerase Y family protein [Bradyrhizobium sp. LHD-71]|uniref:Y-family DNA polymerase n=1 Tax=Bradyrhizobium sp. LHD-71 TaxID=3072141 RepID=UPI00280FCF2D|nr:DNA polymerase Y family protein [Bradyrhizobium sp. LHD-71]MDQ8732558.1 DNA polymerase Y family protein [Bradyrhizobium sp. LHD-71]
MSTFSANRRRILSVWLPRLPTDRIRRLQRQAGAAALDDEALVVTAKIDNALQVVALNDAAAKAGLVVEMPLATARAMLPALKVLDADPVADGNTLNAIAAWCDRFTPLVALDGADGLFLDITGCAHLFGGEALMLAKVCDALSRQGFIVSGAIAGTAVAARALTRHAHGRVVACGGEALAVAPLPIATLGADEKIVRGLGRAGLKTIGDVAAREPAEITARFGAEFTFLLQQALGQGDAPISPRKPAPDYVAEKRFADPVATNDVIAMTLSSLAAVLTAAMERHGKGARLLEASFFRTDGVVRTIAVEAGQPITRPDIVDRLFAEKLDALADPLDPGFGFDLIRLSALRTVGAIPVQHGFDTAANEAEDVNQLVDRLAARIGRQRIVRYVPQETHIPEHAALAVPAQEGTGTATWPAPVRGEPPSRPLRLFERPEPIDVTADFPDGAPAQFRWRRNLHVIIRTEGPERIAMEWWRHREEDDVEPDEFTRLHPPQPNTEVFKRDSRVLTRDYFRAEDRQGVRYWIYREGIFEREVASFRWFLHGLFA